MNSTKKLDRLSFLQIWNMSFGFLGIQFGFALQGGFMSPIALDICSVSRSSGTTYYWLYE